MIYVSSRIITLSFCFMLLVSCATTTYKSIEIITNFKLYPAVNSVFIKHGVTIENIDVINNSYGSSYFYFRDGIIQNRAKLLVSYHGNHLVTRVVGLQVHNPSQNIIYKVWEDDLGTIFFNLQSHSNNITNNIVKILQDEKLFTTASEEFYNSLTLNSLVMENMTPIKINKWYLRHMKGRSYKFLINQQDVIITNNISDIKSDYLIQFNYFVTNNSISRNGYSVKLYMGNEPISSKQNGNAFGFGGKLVELDRLSHGSLFTITLLK